MSEGGSGAGAGPSCPEDDIFYLSHDLRSSLALTDDQLDAIKDIFRDLDVDHNGSISLPELGSALRALGMTPSNEEVGVLMNQLDQDASGTIEFAEFAQMVSPKLREYDPETDMKSAFDVFDKDGDGRITRAELKSVVEQLGETILDEDLDNMLADADENNDGVVDYNEFVHIWFGADESPQADSGSQSTCRPSANSPPMLTVDVASGGNMSPS